MVVFELVKNCTVGKIIQTWGLLYKLGDFFTIWSKLYALDLLWAVGLLWRFWLASFIGAGLGMFCVWVRW